MFRYDEPLIRGTMLKRKSQFTAVVQIDGEELIAHIPTTNRLAEHFFREHELDKIVAEYDDIQREVKLGMKTWYADR